MKNFTKKFGREDQNPGGLHQPPPVLVANVDRNSLVVRGLSMFFFIFRQYRRFSKSSIITYMVILNLSIEFIYGHIELIILSIEFSTESTFPVTYTSIIWLECFCFLLRRLLLIQNPCSVRYHIDRINHPLCVNTAHDLHMAQI